VLRLITDMPEREYRLAVRHKVWLERGTRFALGDGGLALLHAIDSTGSVRAAAAEVGWSYRHALGYVTNAERAFGRPLVARARGGNDRGGATLTPAARNFLRRYSTFRGRLDRQIERLYRDAFRETMP
jgi:molybdate transport system regulatory protein